MFRAAEPWTDAAHGTFLQFTTTPLGSAGWMERMRITPEGNVGLGTTTPGQKLSVAGTIESTTGGFKFPDGSVQTMAGTVGGLTGVTAGSGMVVTGGAPSPTVGLATGGVTDAHIASVAAGKITGSLPVAQVAGAATLGANTFAGTQTISGGNLALPATTGATVGVLNIGATNFLHAFGGATNTFVGGQAGGGFATTGGGNTGVGYQSLSANTTGGSSAAVGAYSLTANTTGGSNVAFGYASLTANIAGSTNAAVGTYSMGTNTSGSQNVALGYSSLYGNTIGGFNVALGVGSLSSNTTGGSNIAVGNYAGAGLTTGSDNIDIGNTGAAAEGNTIRIGTAGAQTRTFIAGISSTTTGTANAVAVLVDSNGQLGTYNSSRRFKDDIAEMDAASSALMKLRPVTFHYKSDQAPSGRTLQYGLIAEEVAEVYPGLVARSAEGQIETVLYQFLPPMLLNEYQKQQRTIDALRAQVEALADRLARLETRDRH
jgi:hypothetical protein